MSVNLKAQRKCPNLKEYSEIVHNAMAEELTDLTSLLSLILPLDMILNQWVYFPSLSYDVSAMIWS